MTTQSKDVDGLLAALSGEVRDALEKLRETIRGIVPGAEERISYGVPAFYYKKRPLVSFGAAKNHCAFYVQSPAVMESFSHELEGYDVAKGTVRFQPDRPLPPELIEKLVRARMAETDTR